jgi:small subunit ribosomal protein S1
VILEAERAGKREKLMKELQKDQVRKGVVKNITDFGAFIDLGGVDGLLHITDMSWGRISHPTRWCRSATSSRSRCSTSIGSASASR